MISELENVLKGTVQYTPEYEANIRKVVVKQANITPGENGVAPLSKQNGFEVEKEEEILDFVGPSSAGPIPAPVPSDVITEAPVLTEDPSKLEEVVKPLQDELKKLQNSNLIQEEIANTIVSPLGVQMPEIEAPLETEPTGVNESLFADHAPDPSETAKEEPATEMPTMSPEIALPNPPESVPSSMLPPESVQTPEPALPSMPAMPELPPMPVMPGVRPATAGPSLEEMLSPQMAKPIEPQMPTMSASKFDELPAMNSNDLGAAIDDRLIKFENDIKAHLEDQIDALSVDIKNIMSNGKNFTTNTPSNSSPSMSSNELPTMSGLPEMQINMSMPQMSSQMPQMSSQMPQMSPQMSNMGPQIMSAPSQGPTPFNISGQMNSMPTFNNPEPEKIDDGPIKGGGMFIQF